MAASRSFQIRKRVREKRQSIGENGSLRYFLGQEEQARGSARAVVVDRNDVAPADLDLDLELELELRGGVPSRSESRTVIRAKRGVRPGFAWLSLGLVGLEVVIGASLFFCCVTRRRVARVQTFCSQSSACAQ